MGNPNSTESDTPFNEHFFGLVNFGNTCYVNSVLQALYFCKPFRDKVIQYKLAYNQRTAHLSKDGSAATAAGQLNNSNDQQYDVSNGSSILSNISNLNSSNSNLTASATAAGVNGTTTNNVNTTTTSKTTLTSSSTTSASSNSQASNGSVANVSILKQEHLLNCLAELFFSIVTMRKKKGTVQPKKFIARLRKDNDAFDNLFQQDAHEFLNYLLNTCADILKEEMKELKKLEELNGLSENGAISATSKLSSKTHRILNGKLIGNGNNAINNSQPSNGSNFSSGSTTSSRTNSTNGSSRSISSQSNVNGSSSNKNQPQPQQQQQQQQQSNPANESNSEELTWIHELFQGILVNETKCLNCETSSSKEENFLDLSVDVEQNTSLSHCLQEFSNMEMLCGECKYYCETCCSKQEAEKRMRIKKLPKILALHLKRFKFVGMLNKFKKLTYRVVFPFELRLFNTTEDCKNSDRIYDLVSFVVHCGMGLNRGHYISVVKSHGYWFLFDDEQVERIEVSNFEEFYGLTQDTNKKSETSYILFYETRES